ncbi:hypothetical protein DPSP01_003002 [Paraphaeosphaeria sporulosa]
MLLALRNSSAFEMEEAGSSSLTSDCFSSNLPSPLLIAFPHGCKKYVIPTCQCFSSQLSTRSFLTDLCELFRVHANWSQIVISQYYHNLWDTAITIEPAHHTRQ